MDREIKEVRPLSLSEIEKNFINSLEGKIDKLQLTTEILNWVWFLGFCAIMAKLIGAF